MMYCIKCGKAIDDNADFCIYCGSDQSGKSFQRKSFLQKEKVPLKEKLGSVLGTTGFILYYLICVTFCVLPLVALDFRWYIEMPLLLILTFTGNGILHLSLYIWGLTVIINSPQTSFSIFYYVIFGLYCLIFILPQILSLILSLFSNRKM